MAQPIRFPATVETVTHHAPDVASIRLHADKRLPRFTPGQFIHLTLEPFDPASFWPESRVFSVANAVTDRRSVELTISRQGRYTSRILDELTVGEQVWGKGPYGDFTVDGDGGYDHAVFIAGGTGVTPFSAFMDEAISREQLPVETATLYYGAQSADLLIYRDLAKRCAAICDGFRVVCYAEEANEGSGDALRSGRIDLDQIISECSDPARTAFYLSGPKAMIDAFQEALLTIHGLAADQVLIDAWE
jgi:ferredoxin-NADP reductase